MTTALKPIKGGQNKGNHRTEEKPVRPHCKISIEDINWVRQQPPCVQQLWLDSVAAEQFGGSAHKLDTNLTYKSLQKASAKLTAQGLFQYEEVFGRLPSGRPGLIGYRVRNLHGYYNRFYWESSTSGETNSCDQKAVHTGKEINNAEANQNHPEVKQIHADLDHFQKNGQKSENLQGFQKPNNVSSYSLTTYQPPTKVVGKVVSSSTPNENLHGDETAIAPPKGASPQTFEGVKEEKEELPTVTDCTTLTLVDVAPSQSTSLVEKNQGLGDEQGVSHEDTFSAAPAESNLPAQEPKAHHEGVCAVAADSDPEKWSYEAVLEQSRIRPWRMEKLKMAEQWRENPGDDFLMECWADDPALRIVIKKLVAKCPQWGLVAADGVLVK